MKRLQALSRGIDTLNAGAGQIVAWVTLGLVAVVFTNVVMRYLFRTSFVFAQELEWHLFAFIFLLGGGYTLLRCRKIYSTSLMRPVWKMSIGF